MKQRHYTLPPADERYFAAYGASVGAAAASITRPDLVAEFAELVAPLERKAGRPLSEPARSWLFAAYYTEPGGFARLVAEAERRGTVNAVGLLVRMVQAGEHRRTEVPAE